MMYGWKVVAWLVFMTANLDQQPNYLAFSSMAECQKSKTQMEPLYRYKIVCVEASDGQ